MCIALDNGMWKGQNMSEQCVDSAAVHITHSLLPSRTCRAPLLSPRIHFDFGLSSCYLFNSTAWVMRQMLGNYKHDCLHWLGFLRLPLSICCENSVLQVKPSAPPLMPHCEVRCEEAWSQVTMWQKLLESLAVQVTRVKNAVMRHGDFLVFLLKVIRKPHGVVYFSCT